MVTTQNQMQNSDMSYFDQFSETSFKLLILNVEFPWHTVKTCIYKKHHFGVKLVNVLKRYFAQYVDRGYAILSK